MTINTHLIISFAEVGRAEIAVGPTLADRVPQLLGHHQVLQHVRDRLNQTNLPCKTNLDSDVP